ncbi:hypothetical protein PIB06_04800 [Klebsiella michiganensis]|nr:hypothetical protein [Klebsiella michiganensis]
MKWKRPDAVSMNKSVSLETSRDQQTENFFAYGKNDGIGFYQ